MPRIRLSIVCYCAYSLLQLFEPHAHQSTTEINAPQYYTIIRPEFVGCLLSTDCCLTVHKLSSFLLPVFFWFFQYTALSALSFSLLKRNTNSLSIYCPGLSRAHTLRHRFAICIPFLNFSFYVLCGVLCVQ